MDYKIKKTYTEKLDMKTYPELILGKKDVNLIIKVNFDLINSIIDEKTFIFIIDYNVMSNNAPISLNWIGNVFIESDENIDDISYELFIKNPEIESYLNKAIESFSFLLNGKLPTINDILEQNNEDWTHYLFRPW